MKVLFSNGRRVWWPLALVTAGTSWPHHGCHTPRLQWWPLVLATWHLPTRGNTPPPLFQPGSSSRKTEESDEERKQKRVQRLLAIKRTHSPQKKLSSAPEPRWDAGDWSQDATGRWWKFDACQQSTTMEWPEVRGDMMNKLFNEVPYASLPFKCTDLYSTMYYMKYNCTHAHWRVWMFDRGLTALHNVKDEAKLTDGRWRLMDSLCHYTSPWKKYTMAEVYEEYKGESRPCEQYIHHSLKRYEGEVAFAWDIFRINRRPLCQGMPSFGISNGRQMKPISRLFALWAATSVQTPIPASGLYAKAWILRRSATPISS